MKDHAKKGATRLQLQLRRLQTVGDPSAGASGRKFQVRAECRKKYSLPPELFSLSGNLVFADFSAARGLAARMNQERRADLHPQAAVRAGDLNALALIDEILHYLVALYREQVKPALWNDFIAAEAEPELLEKTALAFLRVFPAPEMASRDLDAAAFLGKADSAAGGEKRGIALEESLLLFLANENPAAVVLRELFADDDLRRESPYEQVLSSLEEYLAGLPPFGPEKTSLIEMLRAPAKASPHSLAGQLEYMRRHWGLLLRPFIDRLLLGQDLIREESKARLPGPGPARAPLLGDALDEFQEGVRFSEDTDWMSRLVLLAKCVHVWLFQLSEKYARTVSTLFDIPDEELDLLASWGINGLWLIGLWERSPASRQIKRMSGNSEALASAYSIFDYRVAEDLGGPAGLEHLKQRLASRGMRLAADMVPNHMGLDSPWLSEHPGWFISLPRSPFPVYTFQGPDLSADHRFSIQIEDHYYNRSDAAVVFRHFDHASGRERYVYHGNDGTRMPWNDTAQLDYLNPELREAVINTILSVAGMVPIIRFDAAMTLTRKHYQRLWYPLPGTGGDIPSRAEHGLPAAEFNRAMPREFWREVVDRVNVQAPGTLLLAEAFWLLEGYFVRSLGMHRVYNSAFMNFLKDEDNDKFRSMIAEVLAFDPQILKRFVNFLSNPDEETAAAQFGKQDKYFGVCTLMVTLPGLPMFGHGQVEGLAEKFGMEYARPYWGEKPDQEVVSRHEREIFPLLRRRELFAEVENFYLLDCRAGSGEINQNVIAFCNRRGDEAFLVIYHNRYEHAAGAICQAVPRLDGKREDLSLALDLPRGAGRFIAFRDLVSGLEYIREASDLAANGLWIELGAYQRHVFHCFRELPRKDGGLWAEITADLGGRGLPDIQAEARERRERMILGAFAAFPSVGLLRRFSALVLPAGRGSALAPLLAELKVEINAFRKRFPWFDLQDSGKLTQKLALFLKMANPRDAFPYLSRNSQAIKTLSSWRELLTASSTVFYLSLLDLIWSDLGLPGKRGQELTAPLQYLFLGLGFSFDTANRAAGLVIRAGRIKPFNADAVFSGGGDDQLEALLGVRENEGRLIFDLEAASDYLDFFYSKALRVLLGFEKRITASKLRLMAELVRKHSRALGALAASAGDWRRLLELEAGA